MRILFARIAWMLARLALLMVLCFLVIESVLCPKITKEAFDSQTLSGFDRPSFLNPRPMDLRERCRWVLVRLQRGPDQAAQRELVRLGGAAFSEVIPQLDALPAAAARRASIALLQVARRMDPQAAAGLDTTVNPKAAIQSFWREREPDFHLVMAHRWVRRYKQHPLPTREVELGRLDTFALGALIAEMPRITSTTELAQARRLSRMAARATGLNWSIPDHSDFGAAGNIVSHWKRWWYLHSAEYRVLDGPARLSAALGETRFGKWLGLVAFHGMGLDRQGTPVFQKLVASAPPTLALVIAGFLGAWLSSLAWGGLWRRAATFPFVADTMPALGAVPAVAMITWLVGPGAAGHSSTTAAFAVACAVGLGAALTLGPTEREAHVRRLSLAAPVGSLFGLWRQSARTLAAVTGADWPWVLTTCTVAEQAASLDGLGRLSIEAFRNTDVETLMALALASATLVLAVELLLLPWPRHAPRPLPVKGVA